MKISGMSGYIYRITELVAKFAFLQLLWIVFTIVGLGIFGIFPSTAAMFSVARKWVMGIEDAPVFKTFWQTYKSDFFKINGLGLILSVIGYILYIDYHFFGFGASVGSSIIKIVLILIGYIFITTCIYLFPIFVHFQYRFWEYIKYSFLFSVAAPFKTFGVFVITYLVYLLLMKVPALLLFFVGSVISYIWMWYVYRIMINMQKVKNL